MRNVKTQVWHYPANETGSYLVDDVTSIDINDGVNNTAGTFTVELSNYNSQYKTDATRPIDYGDKIKIEASENDGVYSSLIFGRIEDEGYDFNIGRNVKIIKGYSNNKEFQNYLVNQVIKAGDEYTDGTITYDEDSLTSASVIKVLINEFINGNSDNYVTIDFDTYVDSNSACKLWKNTIGTAFYKAWANTDMGTIIDEISSNEYTGNGDYLFYIDEEDKLHFEPKGFVTSNINLEQGVNIISYKLQRNVKPKYNAVVVFAGNDVDGDPINEARANGPAVLKYGGYKWGYVNRSNIYSNIKKSYPLYNETELVDASRAVAGKIAQDLAIKEGEPKWRGSIDVKGSSYYSLSSGLEIQVNIPNAGDVFQQKKLYLMGVKQSIKNNGWQTTLDLEEKSEQ